MISIDLKGKTALVTGATGELGRVMTRTLAKAGADIIIHYHSNREKALSLAAEVENLQCKAMIVQADITNNDSVKKMFQQVQSGLGTPDILVTNAVIQYPWKPLLEQPLEDYESQFRSCVMQNVMMAQAFLPSMIEKGWGRVIGINTECSLMAGQNQSAYVSAKRGMDGVFRVLAKEVGEHQITVNQIAPGWTISENHPESDDSLEYRKEIPLKRRGTDQEIANVIAFIASDLAAYITGAFIPVCGGHAIPGI